MSSESSAGARSVARPVDLKPIVAAIEGTEPDDAVRALPAHPAPIVAFTSGKGGCGKTTLSMNFANVVSQAGGTVLLVDFDLSNRGLTGVLAKEFLRGEIATETSTATEASKVTTLELLESDIGTLCAQAPRVHTARQARSVRIVPAGFWAESLDISPEVLNQSAESLRAKLLHLASAVGATCVVLDCFSGTDNLTTSAVTAADDIVLVNEADIVTFTGTLNLIRHITDTMAVSGGRRSRLHFVLNRVRSRSHVTQLEANYKGNIAQLLGEGALAYFPHNERLARNFGLHPFPSQLLPDSLFVKKLEALTRSLFIASAPALVKTRVKQWSAGREKRVHRQLVDPSAADAELILLTLTRSATFFPLVFGVFALAVSLETAFTPPDALLLTILALAFAAVATWGGVFRPLYLTARLNFGLGAFLHRLVRDPQGITGVLKKRLQGIAYSATGFALSACLLGALVLTAPLPIAFGRALQADRVGTMLRSPFKTIDLRGLSSKSIDGRRLFSGADSANDCSLFERCALVGTANSNAKTQLKTVALSSEVFAGPLSGVIFDNPRFAEPNAEFTVDLKNVELNHPKGLDSLTFAQASLAGLTLRLAPASSKRQRHDIAAGDAAGRLEADETHFLGVSFDGPVTLYVRPGHLVTVTKSTFAQTGSVQAMGELVKPHWAPLLLPVVLRTDDHKLIRRVDGRKLEAGALPVSALKLKQATRWHADEALENAISRLRMLERTSPADATEAGAAQAEADDGAAQRSAGRPTHTYLNGVVGLVELFLLRGAAEDLRQASALLAWLKGQSKTIPARYQGYQQMLKLVLSVMEDARPGAGGSAALDRRNLAKLTQGAAEAWGQWLSKYNPATDEWGWGWSEWSDKALISSHSTDSPCAKRLIYQVYRSCPEREGAPEEALPALGEADIEACPNLFNTFTSVGVGPRSQQ